ncbi:hypothetical protein [Lentzea cavernae]|nr:hypothetical protein [Lentzea cavernae]
MTVRHLFAEETAELGHDGTGVLRGAEVDEHERVLSHPAQPEFGALLDLDVFDGARLAMNVVQKTQRHRARTAGRCERQQLVDTQRLCGGVEAVRCGEPLPLPGQGGRQDLVTEHLPHEAVAGSDGDEIAARDGVVGPVDLDRGGHGLPPLMSRPATVLLSPRTLIRLEWSWRS